MNAPAAEDCSLDLSMLVELKNNLDENFPLTENQRHLLGEVLGRLIFGERNLLAVFGVKVSPGQRSAATRNAIDQRNRLICEVAAKFYPSLSFNEQSQRISEAWSRYTASAWHREKSCIECPSRHAGKIYGALWKIMKSPETSHVLSAERLRKVLVASSPYS